MTSPIIHHVTTLDLCVQPFVWPFATERREDIDAHFRARQAEKPQMWNGRVLMGRNPVFAGKHFSADAFETSFASFLAWRDWDYPDKDVFDGFGMGALRCSDGAFALGEMGPQNATGGRVYFPSGTPDPSDIRNGKVDSAGSVVREMEEETGLLPADYRAHSDWDCVVSGAIIAMIRMLDVELTGEALRGRIEANLARQQQPELSGIHLVRGPRDLTPAMPRFITAYLERQFSG
ncbi:MAG: NUDIX hydrolase [Bradyrhizobium sp.]|nr:NUDIX hydrolase [Bradyrhizobium sp.]